MYKRQVVCCVTILPSLILAFDKQIEKTKHRPLIKSVDGASNFIIKNHWIWLLVFLVMLLPAIHGNNNTKIYYDIAKSMPSTLPSNVATDKLKEDFDMSTCLLYTSSAPFLKKVSGVRNQAAITLEINGNAVRHEIGELQWTDYGISGVAIFQLSRFAITALEENKKVSLSFDFMPELSSRCV